MRILVVEDDPRISADVCTALRAAGYLTETAGMVTMPGFAATRRITIWSCSISACRIWMD